MYTVELGVPEACRQAAVELYWEAFGRKLGPAIGPRERGIALLAPRLELDNAMAALSDGQLLGLACFHLDGKTLINEREGFVVTKVERAPYLQRLMGFGSSAEMIARPDALR